MRAVLTGAFHSLKNREALDCSAGAQCASEEGQAFSGGACAGARACVQGSAAAAPGRRVVSGQFRGSGRCAGAAEESGELRADGEPVRAGGQRAPAGLSGARPGTGTNKASAKARGVGPLPPRRKVPITGPAQAPRDTYALPTGTQHPSSRKLPVRARKRRQLGRNTRSGPSTNSKNDRACAFDAEKESIRSITK